MVGRREVGRGGGFGKDVRGLELRLVSRNEGRKNVWKGGPETIVLISSAVASSHDSIWYA